MTSGKLYLKYFMVAIGQMFTVLLLLRGNKCSAYLAFCTLDTRQDRGWFMIVHAIT